MRSLLSVISLLGLGWSQGLWATQVRLQPKKAKTSTLLYVGTYTGPVSKGIYAFRFDSKTGKAESLGLAAETANPSFLTLSRDGSRLVAVNEVSDFKGKPGGGITSFAVDVPSGKLHTLGEASTQGANPCFVSLDAKGRHALVANYSGGSVISLPMDAKGQWGPASSFIAFRGKGPNAGRQEAPHAHAIHLSPDERFALVADLGTDQIHVLKFDSKTGALNPAEFPTVRSAGGAGPRHLVFHPDGRWAYALNELHNTVTAYAYDAKRGALLEKETVSTLPSDFTAYSTGAEIVLHPSGKFLYASNRGHDSIAVFRLGSGGALHLVEHVKTGGKTPRNFVLDPSGTWLLAANQDSDRVTVFKVDGLTGKLSPTAESLSVGSPVCLSFRP